LNAAANAADTALLARIQDHLEALKRTPDGLSLYRLIERGLARFSGDSGRMAGTFLGFLHALLGRYAGSDETDPATRMRARVIQQRLAVYRLEAAVAGAGPGPAPAPRPVEPSRAQPEPSAPPPPAPAAAASHPRVRKLTEDLAAKVAVTLSDEAAPAPSPRPQPPVAPAPADLARLKTVLVEGMDELMRAHNQLREQLDSAGRYIREVEEERERLVRDLGKARKHSMTDELTGLVRRDVFLRQLEAEISRARRYGFAISLAIIDLDDLATINTRYGEAAGDQVLRCYAREVLSCFRGYDLVARYGGDELAVLFPNTQKDGAMQALEKARRIAGQTYVTVNGHSIPLPGFSSVLTVYSHGEAPAALLKRADQALDAAKREGNGRMVVALPGA